MKQFKSCPVEWLDEDGWLNFDLLEVDDPPFHVEYGIYADDYIKTFDEALKRHGFEIAIYKNKNNSDAIIWNIVIL